MTLTIIDMTCKDWHLLRGLRLRSLRESPAAFGATYTESSLYTREQWERMTPERAVASVDGKTAGLIGWRQDLREPNTLEVISVWVDPRYRGHGAFRRMVEHVAAEHLGLKHNKLALHVFKDNEEAIECYKRLGFTIEDEWVSKTERSLGRSLYRLAKVYKT